MMGERQTLWWIHFAVLLAEALTMRDEDRLWGLVAAMIVFQDQRLYDAGKTDFARMMTLLEEPPVPFVKGTAGKKRNSHEKPYSPLTHPALVCIVANVQTDLRTLKKYREEQEAD